MLTVVNGSTTYNECSYSNATNIWLEHLGWGWDYVGLKPHAIAVDGATGDQIVNVFSLPPITFAAPQHVIVDSQTAGAATAPTLAVQQATLAAVKLPSSFGTVTVGTAFTPGVGLAAVCTVAGNVVMAGADGSTITAPVGVGYNQFGFAVADVVSETATCTFTALR